MTAINPPRILTLTDDRAGNFNQARALARAINADAGHVSVRFPPPWRWLAPHGIPGALRRLALPLDAGCPDIAIGCGRQAALALRALRRRHGVFTVQILDPRIAAREFDMVVTPAHDRLEGGNVLRTIGALNAVDGPWLEAARQAFPELAELPRPRVGVLIGGPHPEAPLAEPALEALLAHLARQVSMTGGSIVVCGSRRTPIEWRSLLRARALELGARVWMDENDGRNPYRGMLAHSDHLVVTADSVNMLSEACAVGVPVTSFGAESLRGKLLRFDTALRERRQLSALESPLAAITPLRETAAIAEQLLQHWRRQPQRQIS